MTVAEAYDYLFIGAFIIIGICLLFVVIKSIIGPRITDRVVTINMVGTLVVSSIIMLAVHLINETYLLDVAIIYVLISFLAVIVLSNVFINQYKKNKEEKDNGKEGDK